VPEEHGANPSHAEYQRKGKEVPFLAQKIDISIAKELQAKTPGFKVLEASKFQDPSDSKWAELSAALTLKLETSETLKPALLQI
jgi:hypothetical protein